MHIKCNRLDYRNVSLNISQTSSKGSVRNIEFISNDEKKKTKNHHQLKFFSITLGF